MIKITSSLLLKISFASLIFSTSMASFSDIISTQRNLMKSQIIFPDDPEQEIKDALPTALSPISLSELEDDPVVVKQDNTNYIGNRLLNLVSNDPKISPLLNSLAQKFTECKFKKDEMAATFVDECILKNPSPSYKPKPNESYNILATTSKSFLQSVSISSNNLTFERTLDLFEGIKGVSKQAAKCSNLGTTGSGELREFFTIFKDGNAKFTIQELTEGGSGGNNTTTTVYYGSPKINCQQIAQIEKYENERIKKINQLRLAQASPPSALPTPRVQKSHGQLLAELPNEERGLAEVYKTVHFCAGFMKNLFPDASRNNCRGTGLVNKSKCDAFAIEYFFDESNNSSKWPSARFVEFMNQSQAVYFAEYSRGRNASVNRQSSTKAWDNAVSVCTKFANDLGKSLQKQGR